MVLARQGRRAGPGGHPWAFGSRSGTVTSDADYRGSGPVIYGADLIDWPCGQGRVVLSTLRLIDSLGQDPVADMLLAKIVDWATGFGAGGASQAVDA